MKKLFFILLMMSPVTVQAQMAPPKCWMPYQYVYFYGKWELETGIWSLPFECTSGYKGVVQIKEENVQNEGYAEYVIQAEGFDNDNTFFFREPCGAMGKFCQFQTLPKQSGAEQIYSLDE